MRGGKAESPAGWVRLPLLGGGFAAGRRSRRLFERLAFAVQVNGQAVDHQRIAKEIDALASSSLEWARPSHMLSSSARLIDSASLRRR